MKRAVFQGGQPIGGQLHHKGGGHALKHGCLENEAGNNGEEQAQQVEGKDHQPAPAGEEGGGDQGVYRQPGGAGHEGDEHDGQPPVFLVFHGARTHNCGHRAAKAHQHGDEGLARQAEAAQQPVHDKGGAGHIARILQQREEEKQEGNLRQKAQNAADPAHNAVQNQAHKPGGHSGCRHEPLQASRQKAADEPVHPVGKGAARRAEGDGEDTQHGK
ncbi:hypothetical protein SDC9_164216 [bioreactor metagenome]|uniref:Uncharacterized protein n=1 Tax=bioreactor metagenome TaxID=1076179 RepID=A0A645FTS2_9ZZZZ